MHGKRREEPMTKQGKQWSRREWLKGAGAAGLGSVLLSTGVMARASSQTPADNAKPRVVPTRPFGRTGVRVSCLALGGMFDIPSNQLILKQALGHSRLLRRWKERGRYREVLFQISRVPQTGLSRDQIRCPRSRGYDSPSESILRKDENGLYRPLFHSRTQ
jgi:hypothetical protein